MESIFRCGYRPKRLASLLLCLHWSDPSWAQQSPQPSNALPPLSTQAIEVLNVKPEESEETLLPAAQEAEVLVVSESS